ncbi:MAG: hypothetical protein WBP11_11720 [Dokdonella sp.]
MKTLLTIMVIAVALGACSSPPQEPAVVQMTPAEKAAAVEAAEAAPALDSAQLDEVKRTLQSEGKACAQIVDTHPREAENKLDIICIETAGGTQRVTHTIDLGAI